MPMLLGLASQIGGDPLLNAGQIVATEGAQAPLHVLESALAVLLHELRVPEALYAHTVAEAQQCHLRPQRPATVSPPTQMPNITPP